MNWKRLILFCVLGIVAFWIIKIAYLILQISAINPPMKEYDFSLNANDLLNKIYNIDEADDNLDLKITDTTDTLENGFRYYVDVYLKSDATSYTFNLVYHQSGKEHSKIGLIGAFDNTHKSGGYQSNDKDIQNLIDTFESKFIYRISNNP
ncbi:MAG: hypothetical protein ACTHLB_04175 [Parafilimonas sp.]